MTTDHHRAHRAAGQRARHRAAGRRARSSILIIAAAFLTVAQTGCGRWAKRPGTLLGEAATADEVVAAVNQNADRVQSILVKDLDISIHPAGRPRVPVDGELALEKPRRFRLRAKHPVFRSCVADLGSNDHEFWWYVPYEANPPALVHCSYDDFERVSTSFAFQPEMIMDSLGLTGISSTVAPVIQASARPGAIEVVSQMETSQRKIASLVTVVDRSTGWVLERRLEQAGRPPITARLSAHRTDAITQAVYPGLVEISWPEGGLDLAIYLNDVVVNPQFDPATAAALWRMPREVLQAGGVQDIDLGTVAPTPPSSRQVRPRAYPQGGDVNRFRRATGG